MSVNWDKFNQKNLRLLLLGIDKQIKVFGEADGRGKVFSPDELREMGRFTEALKKKKTIYEGALEDYENAKKNSKLLAESTSKYYLGALDELKPDYDFIEKISKKLLKAETEIPDAKASEMGEMGQERKREPESETKSKKETVRVIPAAVETGNMPKAPEDMGNNFLKFYESWISKVIDSLFEKMGEFVNKGEKEQELVNLTVEILANINNKDIANTQSYIKLMKRLNQKDFKERLRKDVMTIQGAIPMLLKFYSDPFNNNDVVEPKEISEARKKITAAEWPILTLDMQDKIRTLILNKHLIFTELNQGFIFEPQQQTESKHDNSTKPADDKNKVEQVRAETTLAKDETAPAATVVATSEPVVGPQAAQQEEIKPTTEKKHISDIMKPTKGVEMSVPKTTVGSIVSEFEALGKAISFAEDKINKADIEQTINTRIKNEKDIISKQRDRVSTIEQILNKLEKGLKATDPKEKIETVEQVKKFLEGLSAATGNVSRANNYRLLTEVYSELGIEYEEKPFKPLVIKKLPGDTSNLKEFLDKFKSNLQGKINECLDKDEISSAIVKRLSSSFLNDEKSRVAAWRLINRAMLIFVSLDKLKEDLEKAKNASAGSVVKNEFQNKINKFRTSISDFKLGKYSAVFKHVIQNMEDYLHSKTKLTTTGLQEKIDAAKEELASTLGQTIDKVKKIEQTVKLEHMKGRIVDKEGVVQRQSILKGHIKKVKRKDDIFEGAKIKDKDLDRIIADRKKAEEKRQREKAQVVGVGTNPESNRDEPPTTTPASSSKTIPSSVSEKKEATEVTSPAERKHDPSVSPVPAVSPVPVAAPAAAASATSPKGPTPTTTQPVSTSSASIPEASVAASPTKPKSVSLPPTTTGASSPKVSAGRPTTPTPVSDRPITPATPVSGVKGPSISAGSSSKPSSVPLPSSPKNPPKVSAASAPRVDDKIHVGENGEIDHARRAAAAAKASTSNKSSLFFIKQKVTEKLMQEQESCPRVSAKVDISHDDFVTLCDNLNKTMQDYQSGKTPSDNLVVTLRSAGSKKPEPAKPVGAEPSPEKLQEKNPFEDLKGQWKDGMSNTYQIVSTSPDGSSKTALEITHIEKERKIEITAASHSPEDEELYLMVKALKDIGQTQFNIEQCEDNPLSAVKLFVIGKAMGLTPIFKDGIGIVHETTENHIKGARETQEGFNLATIYENASKKDVTQEQLKEYLTQLTPEKSKEGIKPSH